MIPDRKAPVTRQPAGGKAFILTDSTKVPYPLFRDEDWVYVGTVGDGNGVSDYLLKVKNPHPYRYADTPGPPAFQNSWTVPTSGAPVKFNLDNAGWLHIEGDFVGGDADTTVFTLPSEFRPPYDTPYILPTTNPIAFAIIIVEAAGDVVYKGTVQGLAAIPGLVGGTYGSATQVPQITVDINGRVISVSNVSIQITESQVTSLVSDLAAKIPKSVVTATGDLIAATASATVTNLPIGTNGQVLTVSVGASTSLAWTTVTAGTAGVSLETSLILGLGL